MAFEQKTWTNRVAEFINRRILTKEDGTTELVTVARSEGQISQEGDAFNADTMNDLEQRVADEFARINTDLHKNTIGLSTLLSTDKYTFPCDGYVRVYTDGSGGISINVAITDSNDKIFTSMSANPSLTSINLFVKKGMKAYIISQTNTTNAKAWFFPLE